MSLLKSKGNSKRKSMSGKPIIPKWRLKNSPNKSLKIKREKLLKKQLKLRPSVSD